MAKARSPSKDSTHRFGGDWTDAKLDVLAKYLKSYTTALQGKPTPEQPFRKAYIDAFAGTGTRTAREPDSNGASEALLFPLKQVFAGVAEVPGVLWNSSNNPLYLLCFAAGNEKGAPIAVKIANRALKEVR